MAPSSGSTPVRGGSSRLGCRQVHPGAKARLRHPRVGAAEAQPPRAASPCSSPSVWLFSAQGISWAWHSMCSATLNSSFPRTPPASPEPTYAPATHSVPKQGAPRVCSPQGAKAAHLISARVPSQSLGLVPGGEQQGGSPPTISHGVPQAANHILPSVIFSRGMWHSPFPPHFSKHGAEQHVCDSLGSAGGGG